MNEDANKLSVLEVRDFDRDIVDVLWDKDESEANVVENKFRVTVTCEEDPDDRLPTLDVGLDEKVLGAIIVLDVDASVFALVVADGFDDKLIEVPADRTEESNLDDELLDERDGAMTENIRARMKR